MGSFRSDMKTIKKNENHKNWKNKISNISKNCMEQIIHLTQLSNKKMIKISRRHGKTHPKRIYINGQ